MKNNTIPLSVIDDIRNQCNVPKGATLIVGLSGGPDSVFLLHMLQNIKQELDLTLIVAHINHEWRAESEKEAQFCRELARDLGLQYTVQKLSEASSDIKFNGSKEEYARNVRRMFFEQLCDEFKADGIVLAHHADDQQETFFIRLLRGATITGLSGMRMRHGRYIRPLLNYTKKDILDYLHKNNITYCIDQSNESDQYLRNRIRNKLLPSMQEVDARAQGSIARTIAQLQHTEDYLRLHTQQVWDTIAHQKNDVWHVSIDVLCSLHIAMRHRIFVHWFSLEKVSYVPTQKFFTEIERFLSNSKSNSHAMHTTWSLKKYKKNISIVRRKN